MFEIDLTPTFRQYTTSQWDSTSVTVLCKSVYRKISHKLISNSRRYKLRSSTREEEWGQSIVATAPSGDRIKTQTGSADWFSDNTGVLGYQVFPKRPTSITHLLCTITTSRSKQTLTPLWLRINNSPSSINRYLILILQLLPSSSSIRLWATVDPAFHDRSDLIPTGLIRSLRVPSKQLNCKLGNGCEYLRRRVSFSLLCLSL